MYFTHTYAKAFTVLDALEDPIWVQAACPFTAYQPFQRRCLSSSARTFAANPTGDYSSKGYSASEATEYEDMVQVCYPPFMEEIAASMGVCMSVR